MEKKKYIAPFALVLNIGNLLVVDPGNIDPGAGMLSSSVDDDAPGTVIGNR